MDLDLTDEQRMLADAVNGLLEKRYDANARLQLLEHRRLGWSRELWKQYAELGLLGLTFDEQYGGAGMGVGELSVVMEAFGRALVLEPFVATVVLGGSLVAAAGTPEQKQAILPGVAGGETLLAFAGTEAGSRWSLTDIDDHGDRRPATAGRCPGEKIAVLGGDVADQLIVSAQTPDGDGRAVPRRRRDVTRDAYRMQDGLRRRRHRCSTDAPAQPLGSPADALAHIESVARRRHRGAVRRGRRRDGPHALADRRLPQDAACSSASRSRCSRPCSSAPRTCTSRSSRPRAWRCWPGSRWPTTTSPSGAARSARPRSRSTSSARHVGQEAIQLHGGIGMTMEYPVGHYVKRTAVIAKTFADTDTLLEAVGAGGGFVREA